MTMARQAAELAHRLARDAEAVCRHYLSNGPARADTGWSATFETRPVAPYSSG
jgi:hypothetical protein